MPWTDNERDRLQELGLLLEGASIATELLMGPKAANWTGTQWSQQIVSLDSGEVLGVEALTRFDTEPARPDVWFAGAKPVRSQSREHDGPRGSVTPG